MKNKHPANAQEAVQVVIDGVKDMPCILCNGPPHTTGVFIPCEEGIRLMGISVRDRLNFIVGYSLCEVCSSKPDADDLVTDAMLRQSESIKRDYQLKSADPTSN